VRDAPGEHRLAGEARGERGLHDEVVVRIPPQRDGRGEQPEPEQRHAAHGHAQARHAADHEQARDPGAEADHRAHRRGILGTYVNATIGYPALAARTGKSTKSLLRMLGPSGNPRANNLFEIIKFLKEYEKVRLEIRIRTG